MISIKGQKVGILRKILEVEKTTQTILYGNIVKECEILGIRPITKSEISHLSYGDRPDRKISTYIKLLIGINAIRRRTEPYTLEEIIEKDEIIESARKS
jgi:hypothetical protein